ncbi:MAG: hypothetical protein JXM75_02815 [Chromatiaceae bacterium]|nr:hypothetical protein [Chromatiaceae bacterium]
MLADKDATTWALLDIGLPGMDGLEIARRLRARYPDLERLKLVALTGLGHEQARERSLAAGFDEAARAPGAAGRVRRANSAADGNLGFRAPSQNGSLCWLMLLALRVARDLAVSAYQSP